MIVCAVFTGSHPWQLQNILHIKSPAPSITDLHILDTDDETTILPEWAHCTVGDSLELSATVTGQAPVQYSWNLDGCCSPGIQLNEQASVTPEKPGTYHIRLSVWNKYGVSQSSFELAVYDQIDTQQQLLADVPGLSARVAISNNGDQYILAVSGYQVALIGISSIDQACWAWAIDSDALYWAFEGAGDVVIADNGNVLIACAVDTERPVADNLLLAEFSPQGERQWAKLVRFGPTLASSLSINKIHLSGDGKIYLVGSIEAVTEQNVFVAQANQSGEIQWAYSWGGDSTFERGKQVVVSNDAVYVTYAVLSNDSHYDSGLLKATTSGEYEWSRVLYCDADYGYPTAVFPANSGVQFISQNRSGTYYLEVEPDATVSKASTLPIVFGLDMNTDAVKHDNLIYIFGNSMLACTAGIIDPQAGLTWWARATPDNWQIFEGDIGLLPNNELFLIADSCVFGSEWSQHPPLGFNLMGQGDWLAYTGQWEALTHSGEEFDTCLITPLDPSLVVEKSGATSSVLLMRIIPDLM